MYEIEDDLEEIFKHSACIWKSVINQNFLITGGTGFFGKWLISSFDYINNKMSLNNKLYVLTRNPISFLKNNPIFKESENIIFLQGDVRNFEFTANIKLDYIIHAATDADVKIIEENPLLIYDTIVTGTRGILELAKNHKVKGVLHTSSGAVYGKQPAYLTHINEDYEGCPGIYDTSAVYGEGKRVAELLASLYYKVYKVQSKIARCFAFVGPYLPLDTHFAIGNLIKNSLNEEDFIIKGNGTAVRSYLYASDLVIWMWRILFEGKCNYPYNVGSDEAITIEELALKIKAIAGIDSKIKILDKTSSISASSTYVPDISKAKNELNLKVLISLEEGIKKTLSFNKN